MDEKSIKTRDGLFVSVITRTIHCYQDFVSTSPTYSLLLLFLKGIVRGDSDQKRMPPLIPYVLKHNGSWCLVN